MSEINYPFYKVEGDDYEVGFQHGRLAQERIQSSVELYRRAFYEIANIQWEKALEVAKSFVPLIAEYDKDALDEVRGIADGAECKFEEIVALNARTEVLYMSAEGIGEGCTTLALLPDCNKTGHTLLGQNWDWRPGCLSTAILLEANRKEGLRVFNFLEAGTVGRNGMNSRGIGVVANFIETDRDRKQVGVPIPFIRRKILLSDAVSSAMEALTQAKRTCSTNCLFGTRDGFAIDIEATPDSFYPLYPEDGLLVHSNHFLYPNIVEIDTSKSKFVDTLYRSWRLNELLSPIKGNISVDDIKRGLTDHFGYPKSICRHPDMDPNLKESEKIQTLGSIIMDLNSGRIEFAAGPPCQSSYQSYQIDMDA
jgi:isopenicillin-N N-acyltransferase-like protein